MHASVCRHESFAGSTAEVVRLGRQLTRALADVPGFISYALLDAGDGGFVSLSVFETRAEVQAAETFLLTWMAEHVPTCAQPAPHLASGEIIVQRGM